MEYKDVYYIYIYIYIYIYNTVICTLVSLNHTRSMG